MRQSSGGASEAWKRPGKPAPWRLRGLSAARGGAELEPGAVADGAARAGRGAGALPAKRGDVGIRRIYVRVYVMSTKSERLFAVHQV